MNTADICIRHATPNDQPAIRGLVHSEHLNPRKLDWANFFVAAIEGRVIGTVQMRKHSDGSHELGSLVVSKDARGHGVASRLIDRLLSDEAGPVWMITPDAWAQSYSRWDFERIEPQSAPVKVRRNYRLGSLGRYVSFLKRRPARQLVILERLPR